MKRDPLRVSALNVNFMWGSPRDRKESKDHPVQFFAKSNVQRVMTCPNPSVHASDRVHIASCPPLSFRPPLKMAHLIDAQLKRFQLDPEVFDLAKQIYRQIQVKTAPGSGNELGAGVIGVPAISAYLACVQYVHGDRVYPRVCMIESYFSLNSSDVDYNTAANASCVRPGIFKKILGTIQDLVEIEPLESHAEEYNGDAATYVELMQAFRLRHYQSVLLGWFESTEAALLGSGELRGSDLKAVKNVTLLRCVVFAWVCEVSKARPSVSVDGGHVWF